MIHQLFSIYDNKSRAFQAPFVHSNESTALRALAGSIGERPGDMLAKYPEDFELFYLGTFDDNTGEYETVTARSIGNIKILLNNQEEDEKE